MKSSAKLQGCCVTVASYEWRGYRFFRKSCARHGVEPIVLGMGKPYNTHIAKIRLLNKFLKESNHRYTHILFCDAYDVVFAAGWRRIFQVFFSFSSPLVFSAERRCWPDAHLAKEFPESLTPYRFLNSGLWMGEIEAARHLVKTVLSGKAIAKSFSDQQLYTKAFLKSAPIVLDYRAQLFQSLYQSANDLTWDNRRRRIHNKITKQLPLIFHGNGKSNLYPVLSWLNLLPPEKISFRKAVQKGLMSTNQYCFITKLIKSLGRCNLLVIGGSQDSELWYHCSRGSMSCVEDKFEWLPQLPCELVWARYQGTVGKWLNRIEAPREIVRSWDIVLVDGPEGDSPNSIGRQEPISWAAQYAKKIVLVHDYDRSWERRLCDHYLGKPTKIVACNGIKSHQLAVFTRSKSVKIIKF